MTTHLNTCSYEICLYQVESRVEERGNCPVEIAGRGESTGDAFIVSRLRKMFIC